MEVIHTYQANLATFLNEPVLHAMQYDGARKITVQLYSGHAVWAVPEGVTAGIGYTLPNRQSEYYEELSDGTAACTVEGNTVTAVLAPSLTSVVGEVKASIIFAKDGIQLSTFPFRIRVTARPGEVDSATRPDVASPFVGKLYYGGDNGLAVPLRLGSGVRVEQQPDGGFMLVAEGDGSSGGTKPETVAEMISTHNVQRYAHEDIRIELRVLANRFNALANSDDLDLDQLSEIVAYIRSNRTLIDAITTAKVSVADIVNNIVTNAANKPLSAAMGVSLAGEIDSVRSSLAGYQPKGNYLTEHQDLGHLLPREELPTAIDTALAQARDSGAFDGVDGTPGKDGTDGKTPVRGVDYWTPADQEAIVQQVIAALGTPVFGRVDADYNIVLTGELAVGTYTVKYEDVDGTVTEIGELVQGPTYTNQLPISTDTDGSVYNGTGYKINTRGNSSGEPADFDPKISGFVPFWTGFIPVKQGDVIRLKNCYLEVSNTESRNEAYTNVGGSGYWGIRSGVYDSGKNKLQVVSWGQLINMEQNVFSDYDKTSGEITAFTVAYSGASFVRLTLATNGSPADAIITVNEEIV